MLIKKLGGVAELEKQLEGSAGDSTTPAISKSLYERVINQQTSRFQTQQRNGPTGPQNEGLPRDNSRSNFRKDKPSYVTIRRDRPTSERTSPSEYEDEEAEEESVDGNRPKYTPIQRNRGSQTEGIEADKPTTERERNKLRYQNVDRFRSRTRPDTSQTPAETEDEAEEEEIPTSSRRQLSTTLRYTNIFRGRTPADPSTSTTSRYVTLQRQRSQPAGNDAGTTENELVDSDEVVQEREVETTTTLRPSRVKVSESELPLTTTPTAIRTSTRVVTSVVEGATKRQRVPLHMLHELLKDSENFVDSVTKPYRRKAATTSTTTEAVTVSPRASGFRTRRPIVITTTVRTTPAYIALRRNRLKTPITTTEAAEASTKHKGFIPSRTRGRTTAGPSESLEEISEEDDKETKPPRGFFPRQRLTTTESSLTSTKRQIERNRFSARRSTTTAAPIEEEDKQATREYFRDTNVIRKPGGVKSRFPSRRQPTTPSANYDNSTAAITSTDKSTSPLEESSSTTEAPSTGTSSTSQTAQAEQNTTETVKSSPAANSTLEENITPDANNSTTGEMTTEAVTNEIGEVESKDIQINSTSENSSDSSTTEAPATTSSPVSVTVPILVTSSSTSATTIPTSSANRFYRPKSHSVQIISTNETDSIIDGSNQIVRNRTKIILRRRKPTEEEVVTPLDSLGVGSTPRTAVRGEKVVIRRRKPQVTPKTPDFTDDDYGFLDNVVSSTYAPTKARGRSRFATSIRDELDEDQTTATSLRTRTTAGNQNLISRSRSSISTTVPSTRSRSRSASDRGTTSAPATSREASSNFPSRQRTATTRRYQEISRESERASDSREGRSRSRPAAEETSKRRTPSVEREPSESARRRHRVPSPSESQAGEPEAKAARTLQRGKKKFSVQEFASLEGISEDDNGDEVPRKLSSQSRNAVSTSKRGDEQKKKVRKVILRKPVKDLAVGESGIPEQETYYNGLEDDPSNFDGETVKLFDSLIVDNDIDIAKQSLAMQNSSRSDADERDEAHLKQPVTDLPSASDESIYRGRVTPSGSFETSGEPDVVTIDEHSSYDSDEESIPDLANVAVAAIQSLATSAPTDATEQYITTTVRPTFREIVHQKEQPRVRPTRPPHRPPVQIPESPPIPAIVPLRNVVRSSPRPFSKVLPIPARQHPRVLGAPVDPSALYDDYDDFYAEPVEIPLSGKVRIHTDGYIECLDIGNFPHPFSCRKFISCAKMENGHLLGWEYTCPKGLSFDPIGGICNWNAGLGCKE
ncbi:unnamed protein product [Nesidiocoris tenuis]|uniref:Chitin-binding type-2 domain-containing protein n=1 Tax=Nesidiocoris tenuis TaxID=355587 RepID=A0A6H5GJ79_9HEMI|nr:unnamed protein product [Nesidiocoris tenuis]